VREPIERPGETPVVQHVLLLLLQGRELLHLLLLWGRELLLLLLALHVVCVVDEVDLHSPGLAADLQPA
jgi:hypothetical protein